MIVALAGGVGGARMATGLAAAAGASRVSVVVNTADDFVHLGFAISPDLDTVMYTMAGLENPAQGWGLADETWQFMDALQRLGGETWFRLGDRDLATHVVRTERLARGDTLTAITRDLARALGVQSAILPMCDTPVRTLVDTSEGRLAFQEYFVQRRCDPRFLGVHFEGCEFASTTADVQAALSDPQLEVIVLCPSNPYISIAPLLSVSGLREALARRRVPLVAVSPIVGGVAIKGPAAKMMRELGTEVSALGIARHYQGLIDGLVIDEADRAHGPAIEGLGMAVHVTDTIMRDANARRSLADATLRFAGTLRRQG